MSRRCPVHRMFSASGRVLQVALSVLSVHVDDTREIGAVRETVTPHGERVPVMCDWLVSQLHGDPCDMVVAHRVRPESLRSLLSRLPQYALVRQLESLTPRRDQCVLTRFGVAEPSDEVMNGESAVLPSPTGTDLTAFLCRSDDARKWGFAGDAGGAPYFVRCSPLSQRDHEIRVSAADFRLPPTNGIGTLERYLTLCRGSQVDLLVGNLHLASRELAGKGYRDSLLDAISAGFVAPDADTRSFDGVTNSYYKDQTPSTNRFHRCVYRRQSLKVEGFVTHKVFLDDTSTREATSLRPLQVTFGLC